MVVGEYLNDERFENMFKTGGVYWLASAYSSGSLWRVYADGNVISGGDVVCGVRPVVSLKSTVKAVEANEIGGWEIGL